MASYENYSSTEAVSYLTTNGGATEGDLYGETVQERTTSTAYKMVYKGSGTLNLVKGDAVWETCGHITSGTGAWFSSGAQYAQINGPFFVRGISGYSSSFDFSASVGNAYEKYSFRPILAF